MVRYLAIVLAIVVLACKSEAPDEAPSSKPAPAAVDETTMCKEHGVLESVCTKCNPALIAVFKAKGDWCEQHGFPESFCPICHPERGGRPQNAQTGKPAAAPGKPIADGTKVRFKNEDIGKLAGIKTQKIEARLDAGGLLANAKIAYDATRHARVNARAAGVVRELKVDLGARVKKGDVLAVLDSAQVGAERSLLAGVASRIDTAKKNYDRLMALEKDGITTRKDVLEAKRELDEATAERAALSSSLTVSGAQSGGGVAYSLKAPFDGTVTRRNATIGENVDSEEVLFEVVDLSRVWADIDVPESDLVRVSTGRRVFVQVDVLPSRQFEGKIEYIAAEIDPKTRTATARVALDNAGEVLKANMFAQARILLGDEKPRVVVPSAAIQRASNGSLVFVKKSETEYEARRVKLGPLEDGFAEVLDASIAVGDEIATEGSFLLKTETLKDSIGAGCCADD
ncbi:MAG: efflux RND transporter periplasmic adaptor subunit [Polyangiaceae bacterium]|nr:efflux RND transporter periplasmic adaptor subunit [Polyangiaceae bacterium]